MKLLLAEINFGNIKGIFLFKILLRFI